LAEDLDLCHEVLAAICANVTVPVSLKIRAWARCHTREGFVTGPDIVERMSDLPLACITVHGRGTENPFGGEVNLQLIEAVKKMHAGLVLANGSIVDGPSAKKALDVTAADGVAVARGSWGKPWVFNEIKAYLQDKPYTQPTIDEIKKIILQHAELAEQRFGQTGVIEARKHFLWYTRGWPDGAAVRQKLSQARTASDVVASLR
jgi:tRNA-dihydrouridine synthase B